MCGRGVAERGTLNVIRESMFGLISALFLLEIRRVEIFTFFFFLFWGWGISGDAIKSWRLLELLSRQLEYIKTLKSNRFNSLLRLNNNCSVPNVDIVTSRPRGQILRVFKVVTRLDTFTPMVCVLYVFTDVWGSGNSSSVADGLICYSCTVNSRQPASSLWSHLHFNRHPQSQDRQQIKTKTNPASQERAPTSCRLLANAVNYRDKTSAISLRQPTTKKKNCRYIKV